LEQDLENLYRRLGTIGEEEVVDATWNQAACHFVHNKKPEWFKYESKWT
jgi:hypothetical protein